MRSLLWMVLSLVVAVGCSDDDETGNGTTGGSGGSGGTGGTSSGGTGGATSTGGNGGAGAQAGSSSSCGNTGSCEVCFTCMIAPDGGCAAAAAACAAECQAYIECIEPCIEVGGPVACMDDCIAQYPVGAEQHQARAGCVFCSDECMDPCANIAAIYYPPIGCM